MDREGPQPIRSRVARILGRGRGCQFDRVPRPECSTPSVELDDPELARRSCCSAYPRLPEFKPRAIELLTERPAWAKALLSAVADKTIPASALNVTQLRKLQGSKDPGIAGAVKAIWGTIREGRNPRRERVVNEIRDAIRRMPGDPVAGRAVFDKLCAQCHKIHGQGQDVGPDLTANGRNDFDQLVSNVFDPSLVIGPGYRATTVATEDGACFGPAGRGRQGPRSC